jgi:hypothetical protein
MKKARLLKNPWRIGTIMEGHLERHSTLKKRTRAGQYGITVKLMPMKRHTWCGGRSLSCRKFQYQIERTRSGHGANPPPSTRKKRHSKFCRIVFPFAFFPMEWPLIAIGHSLLLGVFLSLCILFSSTTSKQIKQRHVVFSSC